MLSEYLGVLLMLGLALSLTAAVLGIQIWRERRRASPPEPEPLLEREPPSASDRPSEAVGFHLLGVLLVTFAAAAVFFYPWGATFAESGTRGYVAIAAFAAPLAVAWLYAWRKGALEW